ncbi:MAG: GIY-YIG nuclease family protein [Spirochaetes bacterium]|nr:GIY-YIG nuclease family protein [Spirochaetota bacterium]
MDRYYYVYIMTTRKNTALYTGVTNDLKRRIYEHKEKLIEGFTKRYNINKLVYYEIFTNSIDAIKREKQLKGGSRKKKVELINGMNNGWVDLYNQI